MCPDSDKKKKKMPPKRHTDEGKKDQGDSAHYKKWIGLFTAKEMKACMDEIKEVEQKAKDEIRNLNSPGMRSVKSMA